MRQIEAKLRVTKARWAPKKAAERRPEKIKRRFLNSFVSVICFTLLYITFCTRQLLDNGKAFIVLVIIAVKAFGVGLF